MRTKAGMAVFDGGVYFVARRTGNGGRLGRYRGQNLLGCRLTRNLLCLPKVISVKIHTYHANSSLDHLDLLKMGLTLGPLGEKLK